MTRINDARSTASSMPSELMPMAIRERELVGQYIRRILLDLLTVPLAFYLAWLIRFDGTVPIREWRVLTVRLLPIALTYIVINLAFGVYRRLWAYASFRDVIVLCETVGLGTLVLVVVNFALTSRYGYRLSTGGLIMAGFLTLTLSTTAKYRRQLLDVFVASWPRSAGKNPERVLIVGVNEAAQQLATRMHLGKSPGNYRLVGFIDWGSNGAGMSINGVKVLGAPDQIGTLVRRKEVDIIVIARRPPDREKMWRLISTCRETTAQVKVLPDIDEVLLGRYEDPLALRDVSLEDLLDRPMATIDLDACEGILAGKVVLVTGAAGSIGSELCRQILRFNPRSLLALDNNETGLHQLSLDHNPAGRAPLQLIIADVTDQHKVNRVFQQCRPQIVFHAAAYKHVPLLEARVDEALRVNVMGTIIVSEAAHKHQTERFVFISTDKAVNPCSVMGASKRTGELWMKAISQRSDTAFTSVRFGNVIGSRGSVVPTFTRQIEMGGPVTVTHPEMARFFMGIPEAVSLVLQAAALATRDEIFMLEMGEEVSILELARRMIRLRGLRVDKDIGIAFTGVRPGEKLHEQLAYGQESTEGTEHPRIYRLKCSDDVVDLETLSRAVSILLANLHRNGMEQRAREGLLQISSCDIDGFIDQADASDLTGGATATDERPRERAGVSVWDLVRDPEVGH